MPGSSSAPRVLVHRRHAHVDRAAGGARLLLKHVDVPDDHRSFGHETDRRPAARQRLDGLARQLVVPFDRLIRIGRGADRDLLPCPRRPIQLAPEHVDDVVLDENDRRELVVGVHLELHVIAPGETVMTAVRAAAIRVQRPAERHALDAVQRRPAGDFLIAGLVGARFGFSERGGAAAFHGVRDGAGGGPGRRRGRRGEEMKP